MNSNLTLLIVDDSSENLKLLGNSLKKAGYTVLAALNGKQAIALAESKLPDLILLDVMMPEMNGFEVCNVLKENTLTQNIPVIFLTASIETESVKTGFDVGGIDYIAKPFNPDELILRVKNHLKQKTKNDVLEKRLRYRTTLLKNIGDEIIAPLSALFQNSHSAPKHTFPEPMNAQLKNIEASLSAIMKLTNNLKDFNQTNDKEAEKQKKLFQDTTHGFAAQKNNATEKTNNTEPISELIFDKKNILVVEDNELNQRLMVSVLECYGATITIAHNGKEAISLVLNNSYHIILMDVNMPLINGIDVTKILRTEHNVQTPIIAISGHSDKASIKKCLDAGMNSFLLKPFEIADLKKVVSSELEKMEIPEKTTNKPEPDNLSNAFKEVEKYSLNNLKELSNGDTELIITWMNNFKKLISKGRNEIKLILQTKEYTHENKIFHELNNYTSYFGVDLLREYLKDLPKIHKAGSLDELMDHFSLIAEELTSIEEYFNEMK